VTNSRGQCLINRATRKLFRAILVRVLLQGGVSLVLRQLIDSYLKGAKGTVLKSMNSWQS
jgi:hypothetical protein